MVRTVLLFILCFVVGYTSGLHSSEVLTDAPKTPRDSSVLFKAADSYEHALQIWKTPEDLSAWLAAHFSYDTDRAVQLSETQRIRKSVLTIYTPSQFFDRKAGVCVDLARFGIETLRHIDPQSQPRYLMIEFDPIQVSGNTIRLHWLASFKRNGKTYFFADSKRPGYIAGPYNETREFIDEYEQYRGRKIVAFQELESYQKQRRTPAQKRPASQRP
ncbi:MAG: hypothetical protein FJ110_19000 [Deltaproteobacteria bacterium]|nr:hypothetical protein [Deltaproteobacteria bacterium]